MFEIHHAQKYHPGLTGLPDADRNNVTGTAKRKKYYACKLCGAGWLNRIKSENCCKIYEGKNRRKKNAEK